MRPQLRILRERGAREWDHVRVHANFAAPPQPEIGLAQRVGDILQARVRRAQDEIEKWRDARSARGSEHGLDVAVNLRLVELREHARREALDAKPRHAKAGAAPRLQA